MIGADYLMADGRKAATSDKTNLTAADDGDLQKFTPMTLASL